MEATNRKEKIKTKNFLLFEKCSSQDGEYLLIKDLFYINILIYKSGAYYKNLNHSWKTFSETISDFLL